MRFEERLVRRLGSPFPDLTAAFRRWFGPREAERSTMMAHPVAPPASLGLTPEPPVDAATPDDIATTDPTAAGPAGDEPPSPDEEPTSP